MDAFASSWSKMFILYTALAGTGFLVSLLIRHKLLSQDHVETKTGINKMSKREKQVQSET